MDICRENVGLPADISKKYGGREVMWKRFLAVYEKIEDIIAGIGLVCGVGIMFVGVVARYIFHHPLTFVDEIGPIFIVWSTLIGYSIALRKDEHIKMDILYAAIRNETWKRGIEFFGYLCGAVFSFFMMRYGYLAMMMQYEMGRVTQILEFPVWISYLIIPFSGAVLIVRYIGLMIALFRNKETDDVVEQRGESSGE